MGPSCNVNGMKVPCFVCNSENSSITSELLHSILKHIDDCCLFDRTDGVLPFLLLNGHGSRFELTFLKYTNNMAEEGHMSGRWVTLPNRMVPSKWQWCEQR